MKGLTIVVTAAVLTGVAHFAGAEEMKPERATVPAADGAPWEAMIRALPEHELKRMYGECNRLVERRALGNEHVRACSVAYDALLVGAFRGDYLALRAWSTSGDRRTESGSAGR